jgi:hypothetical protein
MSRGRKPFRKLIDRSQMPLSGRRSDQHRFRASRAKSSQVLGQARLIESSSRQIASRRIESGDGRERISPDRVANELVR